MTAYAASVVAEPMVAIVAPPFRALLDAERVASVRELRAIGFARKLIAAAVSKLDAP
jgi:hypothetical protein